MAISGANPAVLIDELKSGELSTLQNTVNNELADMQTEIDNIDIAQAVADIPAGDVGSYVFVGGLTDNDDDLYIGDVISGGLLRPVLVTNKATFQVGWQNLYLSGSWMLMGQIPSYGNNIYGFATVCKRVL